ncbi:hypothetical protein AKH00_06605 [Microbacterium sp. GCS4]|nr:hypothetical protein AKH00_06605 [Microbacterium sp. GCS4]
MWSESGVDGFDLRLVEAELACETKPERLSSLFAHLAEVSMNRRSVDGSGEAANPRCDDQACSWIAPLDWVADGCVKAEPLITHRFALHEIDKGFAVADDKRTSGAIKVIVKP